MVLFVASQLVDVFRGADVLWLLDNTVSLHAHVKGTSGNAFLVSGQQKTDNMWKHK